MAEKNEFLSFNTKKLADLNAFNSNLDVTNPIKLDTTWCVWRQAQQQHKGGPQGQDKYGEQTKEFLKLGTIQKFWTHWPALPQPSALLDGFKMKDDNVILDALMFFREGCRPEWEDPLNHEGGHFQFVFTPNDKIPSYQVDEYWNNIVLAVVGNAFPWVKYITGLRLVDKLNGTPKSALRFEVWFSLHLKDQAERESVKAAVEACMARRLTDADNGEPSGVVPRSEIKLHSKGH